MSDEEPPPTSFEYLPVEIVLQIFGFLTLQELNTAFSGLNSYIDSIIRSLRNASHTVKYNDADALALLQLFSTQIGRLVIVDAERVDFRSLIHLRSLILKYGTPAQFHNIRSEYFPMLEILHIYVEPRISMRRNHEEVDNLFQVVLSNGFPRLQLCTAVGILPLTAKNTWLPSPALRSLHLDMQTGKDYEQLLYICPNLRYFTSYGRTWVDRPVDIHFLHHDRVFRELRKLEQLEFNNKFILDVNPLELFCNGKLPSRFNGTRVTRDFDRNDLSIIGGRVLPQTEPYCRASFLIEIKLPSEYPFATPAITFLDPIYHPSVDETGRHCRSWGFSPDQMYKPTTSLTEIVENVIRIIDNPSDSEHISNRECAAEYVHDYGTFYQKALEMTLLYGRPRC